MDSDVHVRIQTRIQLGGCMDITSTSFLGLMSKWYEYWVRAIYGVITPSAKPQIRRFCWLWHNNVQIQNAANYVVVDTTRITFWFVDTYSHSDSHIENSTSDFDDKMCSWVICGSWSGHTIKLQTAKFSTCCNRVVLNSSSEARKGGQWLIADTDGWPDLLLCNQASCVLEHWWNAVASWQHFRI